MPRLLCVLCCLSVLACNTGAPVPVSRPTATIHPASGAQSAFIEVTGLSSATLSTLRGLTDAAWPERFRVTVDDPSVAGTLPPVQGRYAVSGAAVRFTPFFPFDPGRGYRVTVDSIDAVVRLPALERHPSTTVTAVYPSSDVIPENTLRLYIEFSAPMGNAGALDFVRIVDERGRLVDIPFLPVQADFWNGDHTRYTLFFDPGRVKLGILPNEQLGRPLRAGRTYALEISAGWRDAGGQPLAAAFRREFRVGPAASDAIAPAAWRVAAPAPGTRDPLVVTFPSPLDHGLLGRAIGVEGRGGRAVEGEITLEAADTRWLFRPIAPWDAGAYQLVALSILEDPAGNRIGRAFEIDMTKAGGSAAPDAFRLPFTVVRPGS